MKKTILIFAWLVTGASAYYLGLKQGSPPPEQVSFLKREAQLDSDKPPRAPVFGSGIDTLPIDRDGEVVQLGEGLRLHRTGRRRAGAGGGGRQDLREIVEQRKEIARLAEQLSAARERQMLMEQMLSEAQGVISALSG